jgi:hypothetical protein
VKSPRSQSALFGFIGLSSQKTPNPDAQPPETLAEDLEKSWIFRHGAR